jgi:3-oxoacyl-[acyl-carrier protein] reductase
MRLLNKVVLVTGAGSGFGAAIARRFAAEGATVIVNDVASGGEAVAAAIRAEGGRAQFAQADVTLDADWAALVSSTMRGHGRLDAVVNNAGWTNRNKPLLETTDDEFERIYAVNVKSVFLAARHAVPVFRAQGGGCFVNIASTAGVRPRPGLTVYNSSKGAVIVMSRSMAAELGPDNIRVNCVNPVFSPDTALSAQFAGGALTAESKQRFLSSIPLGRFSTPLDVANAALFLASDEASMVSGVCLEVDGARCV